VKFHNASAIPTAEGEVVYISRIQTPAATSPMTTESHSQLDIGTFIVEGISHLGATAMVAKIPMTRIQQ
jgi:hypothetical protein